MSLLGWVSGLGWWRATLGGTLLRSGLTSTKPGSLRLKAPWEAEEICT